MHAELIRFVQDELWGAHEEDDEWGFLLVDAMNAFNEGNCIMICGQYVTNGHQEPDSLSIVTDIEGL